MKELDYLKLWYRAHQYQRKHDRGGIAFMKSVLKPGGIAFDIGAHKGGYLYWMVKGVGKKGQVHAFEPQFELYRYLESIQKRFGWQQVSVHHLALSDNPGNATLFIPSNAVGGTTSPGATLLQHNVDQNTSSKQSVKTDTLDAYCAKHSIRPDFLKIDVEGNELKVFQGGEQTLSTCKPALLVEIEARHAGRENVLETFAFLKGKGYRGAFLKGDEAISIDQFDFSKHQSQDLSKSYCNNFFFQ